MTRICGGVLYAGKKEFMDDDLSHVRIFEAGLLPSLAVRRISTFEICSRSHCVRLFLNPFKILFSKASKS